MTIRLFIAAALATVGLAACASEPQAPRRSLAEVLSETPAPPVVVTNEAIALIETRIEMPTTAAGLAEYDRYYAGMRLGEREGVQGVLLLRRAFSDVERAGMAPVEGMANVYRGDANALPLVADGGCTVVTFYFDLDAQRFVELYERRLSVRRARAICNDEA